MAQRKQDKAQKTEAPATTPANTSGFQIESGIELPPVTRAGGFRSTYPFPNMTAGQSFFVPLEGDADDAEARKRLMVRLSSASRNYYSKRDVGLKAVCRWMNGPNGEPGVRVFVVEKEATQDEAATA